MANFFSDTEHNAQEWRWLFRNAVDWDAILALYPASKELGSKEEAIAFYEQLLDVTGKWTAETLATRAAELDRVGGGKLVDGHVEVSETLKQTYREAQELDLIGMCVDPHFGGLGAPVAVGLTVLTQIARACQSTTVQLGFFTSIADMIERFCDAPTREKYIPMIREGKISGSMCLTEPDCGSDLGALRTTAEKQPDGSYKINGTKIFITNGGGGLGFVLARVKGAPKGLEGISLFLAEEFVGQDRAKPNYRIGKIEEKLGLHGSTTCEVIYENTVAHLVGEENQGFKLMLHLMNEARIAVGLQGLGGIEASIAAARSYGETRKAFGKPIIELPLLKRQFADWETERDAFRALMVDTVGHYDVMQRFDMKKRHTGDLSEADQAQYKRAARIVRLRTPLVKYYGAEAYASLSQKAIQAFGGYGFMMEYDVQRFHRDCFAVLLYEGTSQIQSLMAMKDFMKAMISDPGRWLQSLVTSHPLANLMGTSEFERSQASVLHDFRRNVSALILKCFAPDVSVGEKGLRETLNQLSAVFKRDYWQEANRFDQLMAHAETLCQVLAYTETLKVLAKHAEKEPSRGDLYRRYLKLVVPRLTAIYADWRQ